VLSKPERSLGRCPGALRPIFRARAPFSTSGSSTATALHSRLRPLVFPPRFRAHTRIADGPPLIVLLLLPRFPLLETPYGPPPVALQNASRGECAPLILGWQDNGTDKNEGAYFAAMVYLVVRSRYHAERAENPNDPKCLATLRIRDIMLGTDTTVFQFFKAMTKVLELAPREQWLTQLVHDHLQFVDEFKQVEVKFMFVYMLHEKLKKVPPPRLPDADAAVQCEPRYACDVHARARPRLLLLDFAACDLDASGLSSIGPRLRDLTPVRHRRTASCALVGVLPHKVTKRSSCTGSFNSSCGHSSWPCARSRA
jgi:hypothetical protein